MKGMRGSAVARRTAAMSFSKMQSTVWSTGQRVSVPGSGREGTAIAFVAEILNDLIRIKGKNAGVMLELRIHRELNRQISRLGKSPAGRQGAEANLIEAEAKETRGQG